MTLPSTRRLARIPPHGRIAGVCAGIAVYLHTDVALVRALWILLSLVPGALIGGLLAYIAAWLLMPVSLAPTVPVSSRRVVRSQTDRKIAGICSGLAHY